MLTQVSITLDVDWAPDFMILAAAERLVEAGVPSTWYVTHRSLALEYLRERPDLFDLGIHPNFMQGSTHGLTSTEVLTHCMEIVPEARSIRTHGLYQSTPLLAEVLKHTPLEADSSLFVPHATGLEAVEYWFEGRRLYRIPYFWEDDLEMRRPVPCWSPKQLLAGHRGLRVFDFHPIHIYLNSPNMDGYERLKSAVPILREATPEDAAPYVHDGAGAGTLFDSLLAYVSMEHGSQLVTVADICDSFRDESQPSSGEVA